MAKSRVLFDKYSGRVVGILDKHEMQAFKEQRDFVNYHVVKMDEEEISDAFEYKNEGDYFPIYVDEFIIFPHEEIDCDEIIRGNCQIFYLQMPKIIDTMLRNLRFTSDEEMIVKVALGTVLNKMQQIDELETDITEGLDYRTALIDTMKDFGVRRDYK